MNNRVYKQIETKMQSLISKRSSIVDGFRKKLAEHEKTLAEASTHTASNSDADTFVKAMVDKDNAQHYIDYFTEKIQQTTSEGLFTDEEYRENVKAIRSEQKKIADSSIKQIAKLLDEVFSILTDMVADVDAFNELIAEMSRQSNVSFSLITFDYQPYNFIRNTVGHFERNLKNNPNYNSCFDRTK